MLLHAQERARLFHAGKRRYLVCHYLRNRLLMKWSSAIVLILLLHIHALAEAQGITLHLRHAPITKVFSEIQNQTGNIFLYEEYLIKQAQPVTIDITNASLETALIKCFANQFLRYRIIDSTIIISAKEFNTHEIRDSLRTIRGKVLSNGIPLPDVSISVKGRIIGTSTNKNGEFELRNIPDNTVLLFTSIGFDQQQITVMQQNYIEVNLKIAVNKLDEAVVIAYGRTTKRLNTGNVGKVSQAEIERQPISNPLSSLGGRVAGVYVQQNTGVPGGAFSVRIRGRNSLRTNGNDPLYLVDGVPYPSSSVSSEYTSNITGGGSPISFLNPSDISSIEILKDADATSIYGSRGANGVILITTKKAKEGKTSITLNSSYAISEVAKKLALLDRRQYLDMRYEGYSNDGIDFRDPLVNTAYDLKIWDTNHTTDWQDKLIGNISSLIRSQLSISGGSNSTQFLISGNLLKETTVFPGDYSDNKTSFHFNVNHKGFNDKLHLSFSGSFMRDLNNLLPIDLTSSALSLSPVTPSLLNEEGKINWQNGTFLNNPQAYLSGQYRSRATNLVSDIKLNYNITPALSIILNGGYNTLDNDEKRISPSFAAYPVRPSGNTFFATNSIKTWLLEPQLTFEKQYHFGKISILTGGTFQQSLREGNTVYGTGFASDALIENLLAASQVYIFEASEIDYRYQAIFGRLNYQLHDRYLLNLTGRRDGSSRFGPGKQFANFGAAGVGWIFSKEDKMRSIFPWLSFGKIRGSYGITGSDQTTDYGFLDLWNSTNTPYAGSQGLYPNSLFNPLFSWEINKKLEAGLEIGFLNDCLLISTSYYNNRSSNQLVGLPLSGVTGFTSIQYNLPATVENKGWEIEFSASLFKGKNFHWSTSLNATFSSNKLLNYPGLGSSVYAQTYLIGESLSARRTYVSNGINKETGLFQIKDIDHDGDYTFSKDAVNIVSPSPRYFGGWENNFRLHDFELTIFLQFVKQVAFNTINYFPAPGSLYNQPKAVLDRWTQSHINALYQRFSAGQGATAYDFYRQSNEAFSDASFIRVKTLTLSYTLPLRLLERMHFQNLKLNIQAQNLATFTRYKGLDPETLSFAVLPPMRVIAAGIQITF